MSLEKITKDEFLEFMRLALSNEAKEVLNMAKAIARKPEAAPNYKFIQEVYESLEYNAEIYNRAEIMPEFADVFYLEDGVPILKAATKIRNKKQKKIGGYV